jgi:small neutral amino acid transporter SnatA (MarC family)
MCRAIELSVMTRIICILVAVIGVKFVIVGIRPILTNILGAAA